MEKLKLSITAFVQVFFVAVGTYFLSKEYYIGVFFSQIIISLVWSWNVKRIAFSSVKDRIFYSLGAALGSIFGLGFSILFFKNI